MMKTLTESQLVIYEPYAGVRLTPAGRRLAAHVIRRHRLVELFLVRIMGMDWSEVHRDAEVLEHAISDQLLERMDEKLGHPSFDPHGDPIPTAARSASGSRAREPVQLPARRSSHGRPGDRPAGRVPAVAGTTSAQAG